MTEQIRITCPACFQDFRAHQKLTGKNRRCPKCGEPFLVVPADASSTDKSARPLVRKRETNGRKDRSNPVHQHRLLVVGTALLILLIVVAVSFVGRNADDVVQSQPTKFTSGVSNNQPAHSVATPSTRAEETPGNNHSRLLSSDSESLPPMTSPETSLISPPRATRETPPSSPQTARPAATASRNFEPIDFDPDRATYEDFIKPFLSTHCLRCHGPSKQEGHFRVDQQLPNTYLDRSVVGRWSEVLNMLNSDAMPPDSEPQPSDQHVEEVAEWIERERLRAEQARKDRVIVLRRLNREEYNNTIRDLIGVDLDLAGEFPEDPPAGGFDNNGSALTISALHLELYLKTAQQILDRAIVDVSHKPESIHWHFELEDGAPGAATQRVRLDDDRNRNVRINCSNRPPVNGMVVHPHKHESSAVCFFIVPHPGEYIIRVRAAGRIPPEDDVRKAGVAVPKQDLDESLMHLDARPGDGHDREMGLEVMLELSYLAFQTDTTRVVTFQWLKESDDLLNHHNLSHHGGDPDNLRRLAEIDRLHISKLVHLLKLLKATPEGEGTMLDSTMVLYGSGMSNGAGGGHSPKNLPLIIAGGHRLGLRHGQHLKFATESTPMSNLLLTMLRAMEIEQETFMDSTGTLNGLT